MGQYGIGVAEGVADGYQADRRCRVEMSNCVAQAGHRHHVGERLHRLCVDPSGKHGNRCDRGLERGHILEHPPTRYTRWDRQQTCERPIVTRERRVGHVPEIATRSQQPRSLRQLDAIQDPVVPGVVDDSAIRGLAAAGVADPVGGRRPAARSVHNQVDLERGIPEPDRCDPTTLETNATGRDTVVQLDAGLVEDSTPQRPLDQRAAHTNELEIGVLWPGIAWQFRAEHDVGSTGRHEGVVHIRQLLPKLAATACGMKACGCRKCGIPRRSHDVAVIGSPTSNRSRRSATHDARRAVVATQSTSRRHSRRAPQPAVRPRRELKHPWHAREVSGTR